MNQELKNAINRLNNAITEYEKRQEALNLGSVIGSVLGTSATQFKTAEQLNAMTIPEINVWCASVEASLQGAG